MRAVAFTMRDGETARLSACALSGTVVATVASPAYAVPMLRLAASSRAAGVPCLVVQPFVHFAALQDRNVRSLSVPIPPLLPRQEWCTHPRYGWRRSHMYRTRMWRVVIEAGFDLLAVDVDWSFTDTNGFPLQPSMAEIVAALRGTLTASDRLAEVVAGETDYRRGGYLYNVGLMWLRSTSATLALVRRCEARSHGGWEQGIFNEEISWAEGGGRVQCCVPERWSVCNLAGGNWGNARAVARRLPRVHDSAHESQHSRWRVEVEGLDVCSSRTKPPSAPPPPHNSPSGLWRASRLSGAVNESLAAATLGWRVDDDNVLVHGAASLAIGRCQRASRCKCPAVAANDDGLRAADLTRLEKMILLNRSWSLRRVSGDAFVQPLLSRHGSDVLKNGSLTIGDWVRSSLKDAWNPFIV